MQKKPLEWGYSSGVECMTAIHKAQDLIPHLGKENKGKGLDLNEKIDNRLEKSLR